MSKKKFSLKRLARENWPVVIILAVSVFAFGAGYLQNSFVNRSEAAKAEANEHEYNALRIEQRMRNIMNHDADQMLKITDKEADLIYLVLEYQAIQNNLTEAEKEVFRIKFSQIAFERSLAVTSTTLYLINYEFSSSSSLEEYHIASKETHGFDYIITRESWDANTPLYLQSKTQFFTRLGLYPSFQSVVEDLDTYLLYDVTTGEGYFWMFDYDNSGQLLQQPFFDEVKLQLDKTDEANRYQKVADQITIGVAVTTIASVLSAAMRSRLDDKESAHNLSRIRADINKDPNLIVPAKDKLASLGLWLALVIAAFGLLYPLIVVIIAVL